MTTLIRKFLLMLGVVLFVLGFGPWAKAQTTLGSITGVVTDPSAAAVPGARVTVTNQATASREQVTTDAKGVFNATDLNPGTYEVEVEASGFETQQRRGIVIYAHNILNVNVRLSLGAPKTVVQVTAASPVINTSTPALSSTESAAVLSESPGVNKFGGSPEAFAFDAPSILNAGGEPYAFGTRPESDLGYSIDGITEMADADGVGGSPIGPPPADISEVTTITSSAPAEYNSPNNVVLVTKSGTNQVHGQIAYDWSGTALHTRNFFSSTVPFSNFNDFWGEIGGPIKKNKLFFFAEFEGRRNPSADVLTANVPLAAWRDGDFSSLSTPLKNPLTGQTFPGNIIPADLISPVATKLQNFFYPEPNFGPPSLESGNWRGLEPSPASDNTGTGRLDYNISSRDRVSGSYTYFSTYTRENLSDLPTLLYVVNRPTTSAFLSWTHTFSPTVLNEFRGGADRNNETEAPTLIGSDVNSETGLQVPYVTAGAPIAPLLDITGITETSLHSGPGHSLDTDFQYIDNLSWTKGSHFFKFGANIIRDQVTSWFNGNVDGTMNFPGTYSGSPYADFLLGIPQTTSQNQIFPVPYWRGTSWSFYAQDQFKATRRLTLDYGVRYELNGPYYDKNGEIYSFDPSKLSIVVPEKGLSDISPIFTKAVPIITAQQAGYPASTLLKFQKLNFYPRLGLAYELTSDGKTVIRAGYGIYGENVYGSVNVAGGPFAPSESWVNSITNGKALLSFPDPFSTVGSSGFSSVSATDPNISIPYTQQWNVTLERQFGGYGIAASYIGSHATDLLYTRNLNEPPPSTTPFSSSLYLISPSYSAIDWTQNGANEEYNGLEITAMKTIGRNFTLTSGWTWSRDLTDQNDETNPRGSTIQNQFNRASEWGNNYTTPTQHFFADAVYALPVGSGQYFLKNLSPPVNQLLGGWRLSVISFIQTGFWFTPSFSGFDPSNTNTIGGRPDEIAGVPLYPANRSITEWFNPAAFKIPGCPNATPVCSSPADVGAFGDAANYQLQGPPLDSLDFAVLKNFRITESKTLEFQCVFLNLLNHPAFSTPSANISSPATDSRITSTTSAPASEGQREIWFELQLLF